MMGWRDDIETSIDRFLTVASLTGNPISRDDIATDFLAAPHVPPTRLPKGKMAVDGFHGHDQRLKMGKAGAKSNGCYTQHHYHLDMVEYSPPRSHEEDLYMPAVPGLDPHVPGEWIKAEISRVNILLPAERGELLLSLLEAFLHCRLRPRYEG